MTHKERITGFMGTTFSDPKDVEKYLTRMLAEVHNDAVEAAAEKYLNTSPAWFVSDDIRALKMEVSE